MTVPSTRWAVVDDDDPSIRYSTGWVREQGNPEEFPLSSGEPYLNTLHRLSQNGSLSFDYHGSSIYVWGLDPGDGKRANWRCSVDGIPLPSPEASGSVPQNNWPLCWDDGLLDIAAAMGSHTLTIDVTVTSPDTAFRVDWIEYRPQPGFVFDSPTGQRNVPMLIENTDPTIMFDSSWLPWTNLSQTANFTSQINSTATIDFNGTSLSWFGFGEPVNFPSTAHGSYSIDDAPDVVFSWKTDPSPALDRRFLFETPDLPFGPHRAVVKYLGGTSAPSLILDYLIVRNASITSLEPPHTGTAAPSQSPGQNAGSGSSAGIIAGSVVGGLALVVVILLLWFNRRLSRSEGQRRSEIFPYMMICEMPEPMSVAAPKDLELSDPRSQTAEGMPMLNPQNPADPSRATDDRYRETTPSSDSAHARPPATDHPYSPDQGSAASPGEPLPRYTEFNDSSR